AFPLRKLSPAVRWHGFHGLTALLKLLPRVVQSAQNQKTLAVPIKPFRIVRSAFHELAERESRLFQAPGSKIRDAKISPHFMGAALVIQRRSPLEQFNGVIQSIFFQCDPTKL